MTSTVSDPPDARRRTAAPPADDRHGDARRPTPRRRGAPPSDAERLAPPGRRSPGCGALRSPPVAALVIFAPFLLAKGADPIDGARGACGQRPSATPTRIGEILHPGDAAPARRPRRRRPGPGRPVQHRRRGPAAHRRHRRRRRWPTGARTAPPAGVLTLLLMALGGAARRRGVGGASPAVLRSSPASTRRSARCCSTTSPLDRWPAWSTTPGRTRRASASRTPRR